AVLHQAVSPHFPAILRRNSCRANCGVARFYENLRMEPGVFDEFLHRVEGRLDWRSVLPLDALSRRAILSGLALDYPIPPEEVVAADVRWSCNFCDRLSGYNDRLVWALAEFGTLWLA